MRRCKLPLLITLLVLLNPLSVYSQSNGSIIDSELSLYKNNLEKTFNFDSARAVEVKKEPVQVHFTVNTSMMPDTLRDNHFMQLRGGFVGPDVTMQSMFYYAERFNKDIGKWDVSSVTDMTAMFQFSNFNQDIGDWDVSSVNDMQYMFDNARNFNQDLTGWCVSNIITTPVGFSTESALSEENLPKWGTCPGG